MTLKSYIWGMRIFALFSIIAMGFVLKYIDPEVMGIIGKGVFYLVLFFALTGILNLFLLSLRKGIMTGDNAFINIKLSLRQGALLALLAIGLLILQSFRALVWWDGLLLLAGIFLIELYFLSKD